MVRSGSPSCAAHFDASSLGTLSWTASTLHTEQPPSHPVCEDCSTPALHQAGWLVCIGQTWSHHCQRRVPTGLCRQGYASPAGAPHSNTAPAVRLLLKASRTAPVRQQQWHPTCYIASRQSGLLFSRGSQCSMHVEPGLNSRHIQPQRCAAQARWGCCCRPWLDCYTKTNSTTAWLLPTRQNMLPQPLSAANQQLSLGRVWPLDSTKQAVRALPKIRAPTDCADSNCASRRRAGSSHNKTCCSCHLDHPEPCLTSRCVP